MQDPCWLAVETGGHQNSGAYCTRRYGFAGGSLAGAGKGCASVAYVTVGTGIGAGLAIAGRRLTGAMHPEIGHVPALRYLGDIAASTCPFHPSCAEGMAAGPAVQARLAGRALEDVPDVSAAIANNLGQLFATIVMAWSPHRIVAGGGVLVVPGLRDAAVDRMAHALGSYGVGVAARGAGFVVAPQFEHAGLEGALIVARRITHSGSSAPA